MTHRVVPLMYLLDDRGLGGHGTAGRSSTIEGISASTQYRKDGWPKAEGT